MYVYETLSGAVNGLKERGFSVDFNLLENCLVCENEKFDVNEFDIIEYYRFEGDSNPSDESIIYGIESKSGVKGILVSGYGISAEGMSAEMAKKIRFAD